MKIRLHTLWKVPVFCVLAGYVSFYLTVFLVSRFGIVTLPDGSISANDTFTTILEIVIFASALGLAYLLLRKMTRKEIFWSATIIVAAQLILQLAQFLIPDLAVGNQLGILLTCTTEWCRIVSMVCYLIIENVWLGAFITCCVPYIFILFGKKQPS